MAISAARNRAPQHRSTYHLCFGSAQVREAVIGDDYRAPTPVNIAINEIPRRQAMKTRSSSSPVRVIYPAERLREDR